MSRPLNIVYIADVPQEGGASESLYSLVTTMVSKYSAQCTVLMAGEGPLKERFDTTGIRTVVTGHRAFLVPRPDIAAKTIPKYAIRLVEYLSTRRTALRKAEQAIDFSHVDLIHSNLPRNDLGVELARRNNVPHVCHLREFSFEDFGCWSYRKDPAQYLSDGSEKFIAVSGACGTAWVTRGVEAEKVHIVYNGIDKSKFTSVSCNETSQANSTLRMAYLGGYSEAKGVWDVLGAMVLLSTEFKDKVTLDVAGYGNRSEKRRIERFVHNRGLSDVVCLHDVVSDVPAFLRHHDCGLVCSRSEAFGRVIVEYQAAGLAVIGANTGSIPELLDSGKKGIVYNKEAGATALASAVADLASDPTRLTYLKKHGPEFAAAYSVERNAASVMDIYKQILASKCLGKPITMSKNHSGVTHE